MERIKEILAEQKNLLINTREEIKMKGREIDFQDLFRHDWLKVNDPVFYKILFK